MGLSIYYSGSFNKNAMLFDLVTEVKEIAEAFTWPYHIYNEAFPSNNIDIQTHDGEIYGICVTPPQCETISISFLSNYRMSCIVNLMLYGNAINQPESDYLYMLSSKTQFAGPNIHKTVIELFRHLKKSNYFSEFDLIDEGKYWETGDEKLLDQRFKEYGSLIDSFTIALETIPIKKGESFENYFERIVKIIDERNKKVR